VVVPLVLIPTVSNSEEWAYSTGGAVIPRDVLAQRNERIVAWFGATIYVAALGGIGEVVPVFYAEDTTQHDLITPLIVRSDLTGRQSFIKGPLDVTNMLRGPLVCVRAAARALVPGVDVSFFHAAVTFMVQ
jgi:hypothetical protein